MSTTLTMAEGIEDGRTRFRDFSKVREQVKTESAHREQSTYFPGISVESPSPTVVDIDSAKVGMLFSIIGGMIALAFAIGRFMTSELDSDMEFLYLAIGAGLMVICSYGFVEVQYRRHKSISIIHDYVLSFGHLFAVLGGFWLSRWGLFYYCGYFPDEGVLCNGVSGTDGWTPGHWGAVVQASVFVMIGFAQWRQNERLEATILPRLVTTLAPLVVLFIGAEIWVNWADGSISLPLIISMLALTGMGMWLGSVSNRAPLFLSSAFLSSVIPLIYELKVGGGGGLTLLAIVVLMQGMFASARGLSQPMIQRGSIGLVLIILIAEFWAVVGDLDLVLVQPIDNVLASLPLFLWLSLLIGYFAAVHMRRVPWMPIGLAVGLAFLPAPGSGFAWAIAIVMFVYMVIKPQTRRWVSDWTYSMLATSWFLVDWLSSTEPNTFSMLALDPFFLVIPPAALLFIGEIASREGKLSKAPHHLMVILTLFSHEMLFGVGPYLPIIFVVYLLLLVLREASNVESVDLDDNEARKEISVLILVTGISIFILEWMGRFESGIGAKIGVSELGVEALIFAVALYSIGRSLRTVEIDFGKLIGILLGGLSSVSVWDPETGLWSSKPNEAINHQVGEWGPAMRGSMIFPLLIFSLAAAASSATWTVMLLLIPIMVLMREVLFELPQDNRTRAGGIWLLFFVGLPWSFRIHESLIDAGGNEVVLAQIMFDLIMLSGPLLGQFMLTKQGVEKEEGKAADWLLIGVMMVALLDVSGGILLFSMMFLAMARALQHRRTTAINLLPIAWAAGVWLLIQLPVAIIDTTVANLSLSTMKSSFVFGIEYPAWAGIGWVIIGILPLIGFARDMRLAKSDVEGKRTGLVQYPTIIPILTILTGLHILVSDPYLLLLVVVIVAGIGAWATGQLAAYWLWSPAFCFSLMFTALENDWIGEGEISKVFTIASLVTWALTFLFWKGIMQSRAPAQIPGRPEPSQWYPFVGFDVEAKYEETRRMLANVQLGYAVILSLFGMAAWYGIAFLVTAFLLSWRMWQQRHAKWMLAAVFIESIAIGNTIESLHWDKIGLSGPDFVEAQGFWLLLCGLILTWASWRMWDFEWTEKSDEEILTLTKWAGIAGAIYVPLGALFLSDEAGAWLFGSVLAVFGGIQMMIGFEQDEKWRRIYTLVAIPVGILVIAEDISNGVLQGVMYLLAALTLFGQGFLYMNRAGVMVSSTAADASLVPENIVPAGASITASDEGEKPEHDEEVSEDAEPISEPKPVDEVLGQIEPEPVAPTRFNSGEGFEVELPSDVLFRIRTSLRDAEYDGYKPIVKWDQYGRVILDFEALND